MTRPATEADDDALKIAAQKLVDAITYDDSGTVFGRGGNGGLISRDTIRAADELRLLLLRWKQKEPS